MAKKGLEEVVEMNNFVERLWSLCSYEEGLSYAKEACQLAQEVLGREHQEYGRSLTNLGDMYAALSDFAESEKVCCKALEVLRATVGENSRQFCKTVNILMMSRVGLGHDPIRLPPRHEITAKAQMSQF